MLFFKKYFTRHAFAVIPLLLAVLHVMGWVRLAPLEWVDRVIYDTRLRATMPRAMDDRIVIIDVDETSLAAEGQWPWPREKLAKLVNRLFDEQRVAALGFDMVFAEPQRLDVVDWLTRLGDVELADSPEVQRKVQSKAVELNGDAALAAAFADRPVVLGHYFSSDRQAHRTGQLPAPALDVRQAGLEQVPLIQWTGYGANLPQLIGSAKGGGSFNAVADDDGVIRSVPLISTFEGQVHQSFSLAMLRVLLGPSSLEPVIETSILKAVKVRQGDRAFQIPVDHRGGALVPYRGPGGPSGGAFRYVSASDVLAGKLMPGELQNKVVLVGTTAPGLWDVRVTPVSPVYPGVEVHANLLAGFMDGTVPVQPNYALGYELALVLASGMVLVLSLPWLSAVQSLVVMGGMLTAVVGLNLWLYLSHRLVLPLAASIFLILTAFVLDITHGYLSESLSKRRLADLFGTYVPPELVEEMVKSPESYSMEAETREMTVLFCDMRGFTQLSETMPPAELQQLLNTVFSRLTQVVREHQGTIDKYMGDCLMAFWGAPLKTHDHAEKAVQAALKMADVLRDLNREHQTKGWPIVEFGIGLNTGSMLVGDMGSTIRRSYTVMGDAVNLASRLEALTRFYGVDLLATLSTRERASGFLWQEVDVVTVKGRGASVTVYTLLNPGEGRATESLQDELDVWASVPSSFRSQDWSACEEGLGNLMRRFSIRPLYAFYSERVKQARCHPKPLDWDGVSRFDAK